MNLRSTWKGVPIETLDKDQLIDVVAYCENEIWRLRANIEQLRPHIDWRSYLFNNGKVRE